MEHNPEINWCTCEVKMTHCPESCGLTKHENFPADCLTSDAKRDDPEHIHAMSTVSTQLAEAARDPITSMQLEDIVPEPYQPYLDVFSKES